MINVSPPAIPTSNKMGYNSQVIEKYYTQKFIDYIKRRPSLVVLEIGTGYGLATCEALVAGAIVIANDLDNHHLETLQSNVPNNLLSQLTLNVGRFPQDLDFPNDHFDAILISKVLHFLKHDEIEQGLPLLFKWLKPEGKIFVTAISPYMGVLRDFLPVYESRKQQNLLWPGEIENLEEYCNHPCCDINPDFIHVFDPDVLRLHFTQAGFKVEKTDYYPIQQNVDNEFKNNGRECVGIIASKP